MKILMATYFKWITYSTLLVLLSCKSVKTQVPENAINLGIQLENIEIDELNNLYGISAENYVYRYDQSLNILYEYSNDRLGQITNLDVSNPHKILVYYADYGIIVSLDNTLTETQQIDLNNLGFWDIKTVAASEDNQIWLYDPVQFKLKKVNKNGKTLVESYNLNDELGSTFDPIFITEKDNRVFIYTEDQKLLIFDDLGNLVNHRSFACEIVSINDPETLICKKGNGLKLENINPLNPKSIDFHTLKEEKFKDIAIGDRFYFILTDHGIQRY